MFVKFEWDSWVLRCLLTSNFLLGSHEWVEEHDQALILTPGKTFYVYVEDGKLFSLFSIKGKSFGDAHTVKEERGSGNMDALLSHFESELNPGTHATTRNQSMAYLLEKHGFKKTGQRGRFAYMVKETG